MDLNKTLTYILLFFCLQISGQGLLIEQDGQLIKWDEPRYRAVDSIDIKYGYLYNWYVTPNIAAAGWRVPSDEDWTVLTDYLGGAAVAGGKLKETGFEYWLSPNTGATNEVGFNARGGGRRNASDGAFLSIGVGSYWWSATENSATAGWDRIIIFNSSNLNRTFNNKKSGFSVRVMRNAVSGETHGDTITAAYTGNDGKKYDGVVIGTQVWITSNLAETKYNDGTDIPEETDGTDWSNLTTGARCSYNNIESNAFELLEEAGLYAQSRPDLIKYDFDVPAHSRLLFPSDTTHMAGSFVNDTFRIAKWYDYIKRDSLVQATAALQPWFDFDDGSVRFDGGQVMVMQTQPFLSIYNNFSFFADFQTDGGGLLVNRQVVGQRISLNDGWGLDASTIIPNIRFGVRNNEISISKIINNVGDIPVRAYCEANGLSPKLIVNDELATINSGTLRPFADGFFVGAGSVSLIVPFTGNVRTIILFDTELNKAQRILTNKYLQK